MYPLQIHADFISAVVLTAALMIMMLAVFLVIFFISARRRSNRMIKEKIVMQNEFAQQLMQTQIEVQEYTSTALSQELHDNIGQLLSSTKMMLGAMEREMKEVPGILIIAEETLSKAIQDMRSLSKSLNREWLHQLDLIENISVEIARINAAKKVHISFLSDYQKLPLEPDQQVMLFRIMQEAVQNVIKHAGAENIGISIQKQTEQVSINIDDNGKGFDCDFSAGRGVGLHNMQQRTKLLGGTIAWQNRNGAGTSVLIRIPAT